LNHIKEASRANGKKPEIRNQDDRRTNNLTLPLMPSD